MPPAFTLSTYVHLLDDRPGSRSSAREDLGLRAQG